MTVTVPGEAHLRTAAPPAAGFLSVGGVSKRFGDHVALHRAELDIAEGEFLTLLGPSGCGKTTLLRVIGGFERPDEGDLRLRGRSLVGVPPERRPFNMVFQSYALFPHMTVAENVAYGLHAHGVREGDVRTRVDSMLELVNLDPLRSRPVAALSGGQQQRVALARALVNEPEVLLLDEPLAALDLKLRKRLQDELRAIQGRLGTTFVYVTHDQEEALTLSQRIVLMNDGRLVQVGSPRDVYARPHTRFVAEFVGETNVIPCEVVSSDSAQCTVRFGGGASLTLRHFGEGDLRVGGPALAIVRPEHLQVTEAANAPFAGRLVEAVFTGPALRHEVRLDDGPTVRVLAPVSSTAVPGDAVHLTIASGEGAVVPDEASTVAAGLDSEAPGGEST